MNGILEPSGSFCEIMKIENASHTGNSIVHTIGTDEPPGWHMHILKGGICGFNS